MSYFNNEMINILSFFVIFIKPEKTLRITMGANNNGVSLGAYLKLSPRCVCENKK